MINRIGAYLRQKRTEEHLNLQQVAEHTGIREQYLLALEEGNYSFIPGDVFIRGFLRNYGNYLGLDGNLVVEVYRMDLNPEKILGPLEQPLEPEEEKPAEPEQDKEVEKEQEPASSDTIVITPDMFPKSGADQADVQDEAPETEEPVVIAVPEAPEEAEEGEEQPAEAAPEQVAKEPDAQEPQEEAIAPETAAAAAMLNEQQVTENEQKVEDHKAEEAAAATAAAAGVAVGAGAAKGKIHGLFDTVRDFIDENLYETVPDDEDEEEEEPTEQKAAAKPAFSFKVFSAVFIVCLLIFTGVMAYFIFGGKTQEELEPTTKITDGVKSDHSSEKAEAEAKKAAEEKAAKEAAEKKKKEEEEKKKKATNKTLGLGSKVTVQITYKKNVWTQTYVDGKVVEAVVVPAGSTRTYKGDREIRLNLGSIRDVELRVNGKVVPYGEKEWGVANKTFTPRS